MNMDEQNFINSRHGPRYTFVFAQPRSGSTLLMRLAAHAGWCGVMGDRPLEFYQALASLSEVDESLAQYGSSRELERMEFPDTYRGASEEYSANRIRWNIRQLLFPESGQGKLTKTTIIGFANQEVERMVAMIRWLSEGVGSEVHIVFLTRNTDDIVKSFQTREGPGMDSALTNIELYRDLLEDQKRQFQAAYELGDTWLSYEGLCLKPQEILTKLRPTVYPTQERVNAVMRKKLR